MLNVTLDLRCNVCGSDRFTIPTLEDSEQEVRCTECHAFKCHSDALEKAMAQTNTQALQGDPFGRLAS